jgi:hypothetical protein
MTGESSHTRIADGDVDLLFCWDAFPMTHSFFPAIGTQVTFSRSCLCHESRFREQDLLTTSSQQAEPVVVGLR